MRSHDSTRQTVEDYVLGSRYHLVRDVCQLQRVRVRMLIGVLAHDGNYLPSGCLTVITGRYSVIFLIAILVIRTDVRKLRTGLMHRPKKEVTEKIYKTTAY